MVTIIKNIVILIALLLTLVLGYYIFIQNNSDISNNEAVINDVALESQQFIALLNELKSIQIDSSVFSDPRFTSLRNLSMPIEPEAISRDNPFELN
jgi:hypothetical protein